MPTNDLAKQGDGASDLGDYLLNNVEIVEQDAYRTGLACGSFDLTHVRFVFAPVGRDADLLREMLDLTRPGGVVVIQEPDASCWNCHPAHPAWLRLKDAILAAFAAGGGDFNAGQRTFGMLRRAGLEDVEIRAAVIAMQTPHPYRRLPIQFATSLRKRIIEAGILSEAALDEAMADCEQVAGDPDTTITSFIVTQVWGRKAAADARGSVVGGPGRALARRPHFGEARE